MSSHDYPVEPLHVVHEVEHFIDREHADSARYDNREPLDSSGAYSLHSLAARIYQMGFNDGRATEGAKRNGDRMRTKEAEKASRAGS